MFVVIEAFCLRYVSLSCVSRQVSRSHNLRRVPDKQAAENSGQAGEEDFHTPRPSVDVRLLVGDHNLRTAPGQPLVTKIIHHTNTDPASHDSIQTSQQSDCPSGSGISVSSLQFPRMDGCLVETGSFINGKPVYSSTTVTIWALADDEDIDDDVRTRGAQTGNTLQVELLDYIVQRNLLTTLASVSTPEVMQ